jgi:large subunit ribosomal protein L15
MQLHTLKRKTKNKKVATVGRGGKRGKTSGRGTKGQKARSGHKLRPELRDIIKRIPKMRGHGKNRADTVNNSIVKPSVVNLKTLSEKFEKGETISPETLVTKGVLHKIRGNFPKVKILGDGEVTKVFVITNCFVSLPAKVKIEKAGGSVA